ncbi:MAG: hypothetical protein JWN48_233 [Myxococcaceae bacterium]|nr:hypothetical protein [Myxococcaceae bacterium]
MATRKSGDGSRGMDASEGERPGSYAKTSGSRRKRKLKKGRSSAPPSPSSAPPYERVDESTEQPLGFDALDALDVEGEEVEQRRLDRTTQPEWGAASPDLVDDLRRKPSSSRAPRKQLGPLGMDDAAPDAISRSSQPARISTPRPTSPSGRLNVVEINPTEQLSDNSNHEPYGEEPSNDPFGDPFANQLEPSEPPGPPPRSLAPAAAPSLRAQDPQYALEEAWLSPELGPRPSLSSVFGARVSLRPSPPPPPSSVSALWWVVVSLLSAIIVAAGVIAVREAQRAEESAGSGHGDALDVPGETGDRAREPVAEGAPEPAVQEAPEPAAQEAPAPVTPVVSRPAPPAAAPAAAPKSAPAAVVAPGPATQQLAPARSARAPVEQPVPSGAAKPPPVAARPETALLPGPPGPRPRGAGEAREQARPPQAGPAPVPELAPTREPAPAAEPLPANPYN